MYKVPFLPNFSINLETNYQILTKFAQTMYFRSKYMYERGYFGKIQNQLIFCHQLILEFLPKFSKMDHFKFLQINGLDDTYNVCSCLSIKTGFDF